MIIHRSILCDIDYIDNHVGIKLKYKSGLDDIIIQKCLDKLKVDILKLYKHVNSKFTQTYDLTTASLGITTIHKDINFAKQYGDFLQANVEKIIEKHCSGTSIIVNSEAIKCIANTTLMLYRHKSPTLVHTSIDESKRWLCSLE